MKSLRIASLVSALCALWLLNYAEGTELTIFKCDMDTPTSGAFKILEIYVSEGSIMNSTMEFLEELHPGDVSVKMEIKDTEENVIMDQTSDLCSMASQDMCKDYFGLFKQSGFNGRNCPKAAGIYDSGKVEINMDDGSEGEFTITFTLSEGPTITEIISCNVKIE